MFLQLYRYHCKDIIAGGFYATKLFLSMLAILTITHGALSQEWEFPKHNFAITPPIDWHVITNAPPQPGLIVGFGNKEGTQMLFVLIDPDTKADQKLDKQAVAEFEKGAERLGGKRVWGRFVDVAGLKGYERLGNVAVGGKHLSNLTRWFPTDDRSYLLEGLRSDGDASEATDILKGFASFRFIHPPAEPGSFRWTLTSGGILIAVIITVIRRHAKKGPPPVPAAPPNAA
jgi:hypothetical protein